MEPHIRVYGLSSILRLQILQWVHHLPYMLPRLRWEASRWHASKGNKSHRKCRSHRCSTSWRQHRAASRREWSVLRLQWHGRKDSWWRCCSPDCLPWHTIRIPSPGCQDLLPHSPLCRQPHCWDSRNRLQ